MFRSTPRRKTEEQRARLSNFISWLKTAVAAMLKPTTTTTTTTIKTAACSFPQEAETRVVNEDGQKVEESCDTIFGVVENQKQLRAATSTAVAITLQPEAKDKVFFTYASIIATA